MRTRCHLLLLILPFLLFSAIFIVIALIQTINISLGHDLLIGMNGWTLNYYKAVFTNHLFIKSLFMSFSISFLSSTGACVLGLCLAFMINNHDDWQSKLLVKTTQSMIAFPHIFVVLVFIWCFSQTGLLRRLFILLGFNFTFPLLIGDEHQIGVMLTYLWKETPYVLLTLLLVVRRLDNSYLLVARNLGASRFQSFVHVGLPMIQRSFFNALIIVFSFSFGAYEVPALLGNQRLELIPVLIYNLYQQSDLALRPKIMSLNVLLILFVVGVDLFFLALSHILPGGMKKVRL